MRACGKAKRHKSEQKNKTGPGHTRQVLDEALWVWKCERLRCGGVMPREHLFFPFGSRERGFERW